jgi:hypothetical protein
MRRLSRDRAAAGIALKTALIKESLLSTGSTFPAYNFFNVLRVHKYIVMIDLAIALGASSNWQGITAVWY